MINWDEFEHIHVIKRLKHILTSWWSIDLIFTNEEGEIRGVDFDKATFENPAVRYFLGKESARKHLTDFLSEIIKDFRKTDSKQVVRKWETSGFDMVVVPIYIDNDFMGSVVGLGFLKEEDSQQRLQEVQERLSVFGASAEVVEQSLSKIKYLDQQNRFYLLELISLVSEEVITLHLEITSREDRIKELHKELGSRYKYENMIGKSKPMQNLYSLLDKIKGAESTVLIQGDNGTGKELIAKAIHYNSSRKDNRLVIQNCSAFNDNLLESELFGHVKGSFTGAIKDKKGLFEIADKGTFFLDEIGDTSPTMQVKLLRVLQEGTFTPVGATEQRKVNVRVIAATNKNLREMVKNGTFREDLYYRLNVINIHVPSLSERKEDIPLLAEYFLNQGTDDESRRFLTKRALEKLYDYSWPGNVRELQNEVERLLVLSGSDNKIAADILSPKILEASDEGKSQGMRVHGKLKDAIEALESQMIQEGLRRVGWNKSKLAKELGISRAGLIMKVEKYDLDKRKLIKR